jgi:hypothetical protein
MTDEPENIVDSGPIEFSASSALEGTGSVMSGSVTVGDQTVLFAEAETEIRIATAAHEREIERERVARELEKDKRLEDEDLKDRYLQRVRDNCTFAVVILVVFGVFVGTVYVALTTNDPTKQTFAQSLATTIFGAIGGAFAGYMVGERKTPPG